MRITIARNRWIRRASLLALGLAACTFSSASGGGDAGDDGSSGTAATSTGPGDSSPSATTPTAATASASMGSDSTVSGSATDTSPTDTSPTTDTAEDTGTTDGLLGADAVIVRYYLDEASRGAPRGDLLDAAAEPAMDLVPTYDDGAMQPQYVLDDGHRGLRWNTHGNAGRGEIPVLGTKLVELGGGTEVSFEFVLEITSAYMTTEPFARLLVWQPDIVPFGIEMGVLAAWDDPSQSYAIDFRSSWQPGGGLPMGRWSLVGTSGRIVVHLVIDSDPTADTTGDTAARLFVDGAEVAAEFFNEPTKGDPIVVTDDAFLVLGNRPANNASFGGTMYYAAVYDRALDVDEVVHNAAILAVDDDTP